MNLKRLFLLLAVFFLDIFFFPYLPFLGIRLFFFLCLFYLFCCYYPLQELLFYSLVIGFLNDLLVFSFWGFHGLILSFLVWVVFLAKRLFFIRWGALFFFLPPIFLAFNFWFLGNWQISSVTIWHLLINWGLFLCLYFLLSGFLTASFGFREKIEI